MIVRTLYLDRIRPFYDSEMIKVITGIRRCGKSTLLHQIIDEISRNNIPKDRIIYLNFEDFKNQKLTEPQKLYEYINAQLKTTAKYYLFFDEIQEVHQFELVVNSFRSTHNVSIFITGSNSKLLAGELATHLSGRTLSFKILPFTFSEFCQYKSDQKSIDYNILFKEYITYGGLPLVCGIEDNTSKEIILSNIYEAIVFKDIITRNNVTSPLLLEKVLNYVIGNSSLTVSGNAIANALTSSGEKVSSPLVYNYLKNIIDACICDKVSRYDIRGKRMLAFEEKYYVSDLGFFHLKKNRVKDEYNYIMETLCYNELIARGYKVFIGKLWNNEIDFVAELNGKRIYIQVAYLLNNEKTMEREFGALEKIPDNYPKYVISLDPFTLERAGIIHYNMLDFLLHKVAL